MYLKKQRKNDRQIVTISPLGIESYGREINIYYAEQGRESIIKRLF